MKRKLYLRIQAFALVLLIMLTTFIINPQQVQAETTIEEESALAENSTESLKDVEQMDVETETLEGPDIPPASDNEAIQENDTISMDESSNSAVDSKVVTDDEFLESTVESATEVKTNSTELPSKQSLDQFDEVDKPSHVETTIESENDVPDMAGESTIGSTSEYDSKATEFNIEQPENANEAIGSSTESNADFEQVTEDVNENIDEQDSDVEATNSSESGFRTRTASPERDFEYVEENGTITITGYNGTSKDVEIPASINGKAVTAIGDMAFDHKQLNSIIIPDSVITIGDYAFSHNQLTSVRIPDFVKTIGVSAFWQNHLTSIKIPNSVTTIGESAFVFNHLTSITIPDSVTTIGESSFKANPITNKMISNGITKITRFGNLKDGTPKPDILNPSIEQIDFYCFPQTFEIEDVTGTIFEYNGTDKDVIIPSSINEIIVTAIGNDAFREKELTSVTIPDSVTTIGISAFYCNQLISVTIPESVTSIGRNAFKENLIISASIPDSIESITATSQYWGDYVLVYNPRTEQILEHCFDPGVSLLRYIKAGSNIRRTSDGQIIETLKMPIYVTGTVDGNYFKFTHQGQAAYVILNLTTTIPQAITGYAKSTANVRSSPNGSVTGTILRGHKVSGTLEGNWVRFTYSGETCYVYASMLQADPVKVTTYIKANSIIRSAPNGSMITKLWRPLLINGTLEGAWTKFTYNGNSAYVATSLTTTTNPPITGYAKSAINVRNAPGGSVIGTIPIGRQVKGVLVGNMVRFTYNNMTGYISASLLQATPVQVTRYIIANSIIRSAPNGSIIIRTWRPLLVSGTIEGAWLKFTYNSRTAYVAMSLTTTGNPPMTGYAKQTLYVRNTPNGSVVATLPAGYRVSGVLVGNMVRFTYNGKTSYVYASLLQKDPV